MEQRNPSESNRIRRHAPHSADVLVHPDRTLQVLEHDHHPDDNIEGDDVDSLALFAEPLELAPWVTDRVAVFPDALENGGFMSFCCMKSSRISALRIWVSSRWHIASMTSAKWCSL